MAACDPGADNTRLASHTLAAATIQADARDHELARGTLLWTLRPRKCLPVYFSLPLLTRYSNLFLDRGRRHLHCYSRAEPPRCAARPSANARGSSRHCSSAHSRFCCSRFHTHTYVFLALSQSQITCFLRLHFSTDGLSIPFFSVGRHTLTVTRSVVDQPDWLMWVRRPPPQMDVDHAAVPESADNTIVSREGPRLEQPKRVEWPDLLGQTEPDEVKIPGGAVRINEVMVCGLSIIHAIILTRYILLGRSLGNQQADYHYNRGTRSYWSERSTRTDLTVAPRIDPSHHAPLSCTWTYHDTQLSA